MIRFAKSKSIGRALVSLAFVLLFGGALHAQTITDPRRVEFSPSPDHNAVDSSGNPLVSSYSLLIYVSGASTPTQTVSLGKPAPESDGMIRVDFVSLLTTPLGNCGDLRRTGQCERPWRLVTECDVEHVLFPAELRAGRLADRSERRVGWRDVQRDRNGRRGVWLVGDECVAVDHDHRGFVGHGIRHGHVRCRREYINHHEERDADDCWRQPLRSRRRAFPATTRSRRASKAFATAGESTDIAVTAPAGCGWTATSNSSWLTVTAGANGSGNGTVTVAAAANTGTASRSGRSRSPARRSTRPRRR